MKRSRKILALTPLCALRTAGSAYATNGYFPHGYGVATNQDTIGGTYAISKPTDSSFSYLFAPATSVTGNSLA